jgi:hypothetical protein
MLVLACVHTYVSKLDHIVDVQHEAINNQELYQVYKLATTVILVGGGQFEIWMLILPPTSPPRPHSHPHPTLCIEMFTQYRY